MVLPVTTNNSNKNDRMESLILGRIYTCMSSPVESNKLLLVSPAQSFLVSGPVGTHDLIYVRSKTVYVFVNGVSFSTRGGVGVSE
jgi:hypothetical protein